MDRILAPIGHAAREGGSQNMRSILHIVVLLLSSLTGFDAAANDIFEYHGQATRASSGASVIMSRGGESILHNPANLWSSRASDYYVDFALLKLDYAITPPDPKTKPGRIAIPVLPLPSTGGNIKFGKLALGMMIVPTGVGTTTKVEDFPAELAGTYSNVDIESSQTGFKLGVGMAYRATSNLSLGLSAIYDYFETNTKINLTDVDAILTSSKAKFVRPILGLRYRWSGVATIALTYEFKKEYPYELNVKAFDGPTEVFTRRNYRPTVYGIGAQSRRIAGMRFFGQYEYEVWVPATLFAQSPNQALSGDAKVEFLNTHNYVLGGRYRLATKNVLGLSFGAFAKNKGPGILNDKGEVLMTGRNAQDFEALDRTHITVAYEAPSKKTDWTTYASFIRASALNPENTTPNAGFYELQILMVGIGATFR